MCLIPSDNNNNITSHGRLCYEHSGVRSKEMAWLISLDNSTVWNCIVPQSKSNRGLIKTINLWAKCTVMKRNYSVFD